LREYCIPTKEVVVHFVSRTDLKQPMPLKRTNAEAGRIIAKIGGRREDIDSVIAQTTNQP